MKTGLVSVTFRKIPAAEVADLARKAGLCCIEWGGDVHCPPGDLRTAAEVGRLTHGNGLEAISYGSYYRVGEGGDFSPALDTALALGAGNIRVWAGTQGSAEASREYRSKVVEDARRICDMAAAHAVTVSFEYHGRTLTDRQESAVRLLGEVPGAYTYWQPLDNASHDENVRNVSELASGGRLMNVHVYHWAGGARLPLSEGRALWEAYFRALQGRASAALLEFVKDDDPEQLMRDARTLRGLPG